MEPGDRAVVIVSIPYWSDFNARADSAPPAVASGRFQSHTGPTSTWGRRSPSSIARGSCFNPILVRLQPSRSSSAHPSRRPVSIPYWSDFNPIGPARGSPRAALPQVPWRAPFIKVHGPGMWPRWAGFARKWEIWAIGAVSSCFARRAPAIPGPVEARWAPGFRGVTVRAGERSSQGLRGHAHTSAT